MADTSTRAAAELADLGLDPYDVLGLDTNAQDSDIRKAYRQGALKYHPDKNTGNDAAIAKFHALQLANSVLSDAISRGILDAKRQAKREQQERTSKFDERRKQMVADLERREAGLTNKTRQEAAQEDLKQKEIQRLSAAGRRRVEEANRLRREELEAAQQKPKFASPVPMPLQSQAPVGETSSVPELDRTVKVRFTRQDDAEHLDQDSLSDLFSKFGHVETVVMLKDKRRKLDHADAKVNVGTGCLVFASIVGAHAAVFGFKHTTDPAYKHFHSVDWASRSEPPSVANATATAKVPAPAPASAPGLSSTAPTASSMPAATSAPAHNAASALSLEEQVNILLPGAKKRWEERQAKLAAQTSTDEKTSVCTA